MRALAPLPAGLLAFALVLLVGCSGDQPAPTAPSMMPRVVFKHGSHTFSLSCSSGVGPSTVANVLILVSPTISGKLAPLNCGGSDQNITKFQSFNYSVTVTNGTDQPVAVCQNTTPITAPGSITCQDQSGTYSATLTVS
jgi:hypothetical protein